MSLFSIAKTYRSLRRMKEIVQVLSKHGFGHLVAQMNLLGQLPLVSRIGRLSKADLGMSPKETLALRARLVLEELGPTFVKLGQILSFRPDIVGDAFVEEFTKLQDHTTAFEGEKALEIVTEELSGTSPFRTFDLDPKASGSIAQVHTAELADGTPVIVKVKRPGIDSVVARDVALLEVLADLAEEYVPELKPLRPVMLIEEFTQQLRKELDFTTEAANTMRFYEMFVGATAVRSPCVHWNQSTKNVLTLERIHGVNIGHRDKLDAMKVDRQALAFELGQAFMRQSFEEGLFHADPHPGNMLVDENGILGLIDFGMMGHLTDEFKSQLGHMVVAVARRDLALLADLAADVGLFSEPVDERVFKGDLLELLDRYLDLPLNTLDPAEVFSEMMRVTRRNNIFFPRDFVLLGRSLMMVVETCRKLDPTFKFGDVAAPYRERFLKAWLSPDRLFSHAHQLAWNLSALVKRLPSDLRFILTQVKAGRTRIRLQHEGLESIERNLDRASNRLSVSVVLAALIVGSSLLCLTENGPEVGGVPLLGILGFLLAAMVGFFHFIALLRSGRF